MEGDVNKTHYGAAVSDPGAVWDDSRHPICVDGRYSDVIYIDSTRKVQTIKANSDGKTDVCGNLTNLEP